MDDTNAASEGQSASQLVEGSETVESALSDGDGAYSAGVPSRRSYGATEGERDVQQGLFPDALTSAPTKRNPGPTERALEQAASLPPGAQIEVVVALEEVAFDFRRFSNSDSADRADLISQRAGQLAPSQDAMESQITSVGGVVVSRQWITNTVTARLPANMVAALAKAPGVKTLYGPATTESHAYYNGEDTRNAILTYAFTTAGHHGETYGRVSSPTDNIKIAVLENNALNVTHVGWNDWGGGPTRVAGNYHCDPSCSSTSGIWFSSHGTYVASAALGSIEQGQSPTYPGSATLSQKQRSGIAGEAELYYYLQSGCSVVNALQHAVSSGVDVANMSFSLGCGGGVCETDYDCCGLNAVLRNVLDAGVLPVASAGNFANPGQCSMSYPAFRPEVVAVGGVDSNQGTAWNHSAWTDWTSHGPFPIILRSGYSTSTAGIEIAAPVCRDLLFTSADGYGAVCGTSISAPIVSGSAGILRSALNSVGWSGNNARALFVNLMLSSDGSDGTANGVLASTLSSKVGNGRLRLHRPYDLVGPWGWGWRSFVIHQGETVSWPVGTTGPESSSVTQWKWAFQWFENDMTSSSNIVIYVVDTCPPGGGSTWIAGDYSYGLRKKVRLSQSQISNRCLEMRAVAISAPPEGKEVWSADYFHSGDPTLH